MLMSSNRHIFLIKRPIHGLLGHNNNVMNNVWPVAWIPNDFCVYDGSTDQYGGASAAGIVPSPSGELTEASMSSNTH